MTLMFSYLYLVHKKKKRNMKSLDDLDLECLFSFNAAFFKGCFKVNMKIYLLRTPFHAHP